MPDRFAGLRSRCIAGELIERSVGKTPQEIEKVPLCVIGSAFDRTIAIDGLPKRKIAVGKEPLDKNRTAVRADEIMLGRIILAGDVVYIDVARTVGMANRLAGDVSGAIGRQQPKDIAGKAQTTHQRIAGFDGAIGELQK